MNKPGFLILAAGHSRRFGSCKLQETFLDSSVLEQSIQQIQNTHCPNICIVTSSDNTALSKIAQRYELEHCSYQSQSPGLGHSISAGVQHCKDWSGWIICLADMPLITTQSYRAILRESSSHPLVAPCYKGRRGHPVYFSQRFYEQLSTLSGDEGAKSILQANADILHLIELDDRHIHTDIDVPADLKKLSP